ncbi:MAG: hypothetical protein IPL08_05810 [Saprospiraceae bacterium]|nr:hypothetical protein [Saprospiraceae bacterium]
MVFFPDLYSLKNYSDLVQFLNVWINENITGNAHFHIICYSKKLATLIYKELEQKHSNTQLLTSETKKNNAEFDQYKNNIGTNFTTGVDISNPGIC